MLIALLLMAFMLRVTALEAVPPGLTHDEAGNGHDSAAILRGVLRIYFPVGYGREPLYHYSVALFTLLLGQSIFTLRITSVFWSLMTWALTVALARRWWGRRAALFAATALSLSFWPLMVARVGLRATTLPALFAASALAYQRALDRNWKAAWPHYLLSGVLLGLSLYTYMASRGMPLVYVVFLAFLSTNERETFNKVWLPTIAAVALAVAISAPLFLHLHTHPELEYRLTQLGGPLTALKNGDLQPLIHNITRSIPMLSSRGDPIWLYNIGDRPALELLFSLAFWAGLIIALSQLFKARHNAFLLLWLGGGLAPAFITGPDATALRAIAALPAIYLLIALGLETVWQQFQRRPKAKPVLAGLLCLALVLTGAEAIWAYFDTWGQHRDVRVLYIHHVTALGRYLDSVEDTTPVMMTTIYPGEFHDPYTMEVTLLREDLDMRWANGNGALFFPHDEARVFTETLSAPAAPLRELLVKHANHEITLRFREDDLPPALYGYRWDADAAWEAMAEQLSKSVYAATNDPPPGAEHTELLCPLLFGDNVSLVGSEVTPGIAKPGDTVEILTAWEVEKSYPDELVLFTHLLNAAGELVTQADHLDAPAWQWQPGDRFAQVHYLALPGDLPPGDYALEVGLYLAADWHQRLTVATGDNLDGPVTRVLVPLVVGDGGENGN